MQNITMDQFISRFEFIKSALLDADLKGSKVSLSKALDVWISIFLKGSVYAKQTCGRQSYYRAINLFHRLGISGSEFRIPPIRTYNKAAVVALSGRGEREQPNGGASGSQKAVSGIARPPLSGVSAKRPIEQEAPSPVLRKPQKKEDGLVTALTALTAEGHSFCP